MPTASGCCSSASPDTRPYDVLDENQLTAFLSREATRLELKQLHPQNRTFASLERYRLLTYGQQIARAVSELERPELAAEVHGTLRHLIVDEYRDVNPTQERLIRLLTGSQKELCVVGEDQQAVYERRGSSDLASQVAYRSPAGLERAKPGSALLR
jgi:superfamily I DNA/RNA helicase